MELNSINHLTLPYYYKPETQTKVLNKPLTLTNSEIEFISSFMSIDSTIQLVNTRFSLDITNLSDNSNFIINLQRINDIRWVNKFFKAVNLKLHSGNIFVGCVETYEERRARLKEKYPGWSADLFYALSFIFNRVLPKLNLTKKFYFFFTKGNNRVISKAEVLGRLVSCGFEILGFKEINKMLYFAVKKIKEPCCDKNPSYGLLIRLKRLGKDGKIINVYKIRTMHPFAEYLQDYIYKINNVDNGGKFKKDFRIASWGRILRKNWLDEMPMLINYFKGDLKIVGVRPLSVQYLSLYPECFRERRLKYKPGLIPPYYIDMPKTIDEIVASELKYLDQYDSFPRLTDLKYFIRILYNIVYNKVRSS